MANANSFKTRLNIASPTASATLPAIQLALAAGKPLVVFRLDVNQETSTTSGAAAVELVSSTATAPGTLTAGSALVVKLNPSDNAQSFTLTGSGFSGSLTGTQTTLGRWGFNILNGFLYLPVPEDRFLITAGNFLWVRLPIVPAATYNIEMVVEELG